jgi:hypothetical protein
MSAVPQNTLKEQPHKLIFQIMLAYDETIELDTLKSQNMDLNAFPICYFIA